MRQRVTMTMLAALMAVTVFAQGGPGQGGPGQGPRPGQGGPGMMMGRAPMPFGLLLQRDVQTELKMTETQIGQIQKLISPGAPGGPQGGGQRGGFGGGQGQGGQGGGFGGGQGQGGQGQGQGGQRGGQGQGGGQRGGFGGGQQGGPGGPGGFGMPPEERERLEREVAKILGSGQYTRFQQLALQQQGPSAMLDPKVTAKLGLSPEQVDQIRKIMQENRPQMGGPGGPGGQRGGQGQGGVGGGQRGQGGQGQGGVGGGQRGQGGQGQGNFEEMRKQMEARREELNKKLLAVLTSNQRSTWNSMLGEPFKFQRPGFGGPGGPGGPGGQGGRGGRGGGGGGQ